MIRNDCVYFKGETPCIYRRLCDQCPYFRPFQTKILIIKRGAMGDVLRTTALLPGLFFFVGLKLNKLGQQTN